MSTTKAHQATHSRVCVPFLKDGDNPVLCIDPGDEVELRCEIPAYAADLISKDHTVSMRLTVRPEAGDLRGSWLEITSLGYAKDGDDPVFPPIGMVAPFLGLSTVRGSGIDTRPMIAATGLPLKRSIVGPGTYAVRVRVAGPEQVRLHVTLSADILGQFQSSPAADLHRSWNVRRGPLEPMGDGDLGEVVDLQPTADSGKLQAVSVKLDIGQRCHPYKLHQLRGVRTQLLECQGRGHHVVIRDLHVVDENGERGENLFMTDGWMLEDEFSLSNGTAPSLRREPIVGPGDKVMVEVAMYGHGTEGAKMLIWALLDHDSVTSEHVQGWTES